jgi:cyclin B
MAKTKRFASKRLPEEDNNNGNNDDNLEAGEQKQSKRKSKRQRRALGTLTNNKSTSNNKQEIQRPYASDGYQYTGSVDDIDAHDKNDPLAVSDYVQALFEYHRKAEQITACSMESQPYITAHMRAALVNWFFVCQEKLQLSPETIYLAVNLVDRYLSKKKVSGKRRLQVIGAASLLIAAKYEEMYYYDLNDIIKECQDECTREEVLSTEAKILKKLEHRITVPTAHPFLARFLKAAHADKRIVYMSFYLSDGALHSYKLMSQYLPSQIAAAAVFIARRTIGRHSWSPTLLKYAHYTEEEVAPVARAILEEKAPCASNTFLDAVDKKYASDRYNHVAETVFDGDF